MALDKEIDLKINKHFMEYVTNWNYETYLCVGAYGSSKSYETATKVVLKCLEEKRKVLVVRDTYEQIKESCYDLMYEILDSLGIVTEDKSGDNRFKYVIAMKSPLEFRFPNGSKIIFKGMDKPTKVKSINGVTIVWMEECSEIKYSAYKELNLRLRNPDRTIHYLLTTNPIEKSNWVYTHFFVRTEVDDNGREKVVTILNDERFYSERIVKLNKTYYHHSITEDNSFISLDYIAKLDELEKYDPDLYRVARLGRFGVNGTKVLPQFSIATDPIAFKEAVNRCGIKRQGLDFGFEESYNALILCAVDKVNSILYIYDEFYRNKMTDKQTVVKLLEWRPLIKYMVVKCDSAEPKTIKYYRDEGFMFKATSKTTRIQQIKKIKRFKQIVCSPRCKNTIRELSDLVYKVDTNGNKIYDEFNIDPHTLSAIWYALDDITVADVKERKVNNQRGSF